MSRDFVAGANYLVIGDVPAIDFVGAAPTFTLSIWVYLDTVAGGGSFQSLLTKNNRDGTFAPGQCQYSLGLNGSLVEVLAAQSDGNQDLLNGSTALTANRWHCLQMRKNGSGTGSLQGWVNGVVDTSLALASNRTMVNTATPLCICRDQYNFNGYKPDGRVCEAAAWNVALTDNELRAIASGIPPTMIRLPNLAGYWPVFGIGSPEPDVSSNRNAATVTGAPAWPAHAPVARMAA